MFRKILQLFAIGCRHSRTSIPFRADTSNEGRHTDWEPKTKIATTHYVVCLDCGTKLPYDWSQMKIVSRRRASAAS